MNIKMRKSTVWFVTRMWLYFQCFAIRINREKNFLGILTIYIQEYSVLRMLNIFQNSLFNIDTWPIIIYKYKQPCWFYAFTPGSSSVTVEITTNFHTPMKTQYKLITTLMLAKIGPKFKLFIHNYDVCLHRFVRKTSSKHKPILTNKKYIFFFNQNCKYI